MPKVALNTFPNSRVKASLNDTIAYCCKSPCDLENQTIGSNQDFFL